MSSLTVDVVAARDVTTDLQSSGVKPPTVDRVYGGTVCSPRIVGNSMDDHAAWSGWGGDSLLIRNLSSSRPRLFTVIL